MAISALFCPQCGAANESDESDESNQQMCFACGKPLATIKDGGKAHDATLLHDRYLLGEIIGSGGFSRVYRASDQHTGGRDVALKQIFLKNLSAEEAIEATETFHREVRMLGALTHPQVPCIYDHFGDQNHWYLILEHIEGQTLEAFLAQREAQGQPLHLDEILDMATQLCTVLQHLHSRQPPIIYRDLKPSNIMRTRQGSLVLIDFGIARHYRPGRAHDTQRLGSPGYAAPEQYGRAQTSPQSDIYSLGALLAFLLSGQDPAQDTDHPLSLTPRLLEHEVERKELTTLAQRMRSPQPSQRPASCHEVAAMLTTIKQQLMTQEAARIWRPPTNPLPQHTTAGQLQIQLPTPHRPARPAKRPLSRRSMLIGLGTFTTVAAGTALGIGWYYRVIYTGDGRKILTYQGHTNNVTALTWSPDSQHIASASADGTVQVWDAATGHTILTYGKHTNYMDAVVWSPDGQFIACASDDGTVQIWSAFTGRTTLTYRGYPPFISNALTWCSDSQYIASSSIDNTVQVREAATGYKVLSYQGHEQSYAQAVAWSPNGKSIASIYDNGRVQVWNATTGDTILTYQAHANGVGAVAWSPDDQYIASSFSDGTAQIWNASTGHTTLTYQTYANGVEAVAWSPDSQHIASSSSDGTVQIWNATTGDTVSTYSTRTSGVGAVAWSPDGMFIAFATLDNTVQIWKSTSSA